jgi:hypothetical protein
MSLETLQLNNKPFNASTTPPSPTPLQNQRKNKQCKRKKTALNRCTPSIFHHTAA